MLFKKNLDFCAAYAVHSPDAHYYVMAFSMKLAMSISLAGKGGTAPVLLSLQTLFRLLKFSINKIPSGGFFGRS